MLQTQLIFCGDNLQKLRELPDECVDLVYIDPPFNMKRAGGACAPPALLPYETRVLS